VHIFPQATKIFLQVKKSPSLWCLKSEDSLPCSQNTVNGSSPAAFESNQHLYNPFCNFHFRIVLQSVYILQAVSSFWFSDHKNFRPRTYLFFYICCHAFYISHSFIRMQEGNAIRCKYEVRCKHNLVAQGEGSMDIGKMVDKAVP
jgi:hypothetical protein